MCMGHVVVDSNSILWNICLFNIAFIVIKNFKYTMIGIESDCPIEKCTKIDWFWVRRFNWIGAMKAISAFKHCEVQKWSFSCVSLYRERQFSVYKITYAWALDAGQSKSHWYLYHYIVQFLTYGLQPTIVRTIYQINCVTWKFNVSPQALV